MRIVLNEAEEFIDAIKVVNTLIAETDIKIDTEKFSIVAMDPANVSMVVMQMSKAAFTEWDVDKEYRLGIKVSEFKQVLTRGDKKGSVELLDDGNKLRVILKDKKGKVKEFKLALVVLDAKDVKVPELLFDVDVSIDNADLKAAIEDAKIASDSCAFIADEKFYITAKGDLTESLSNIPGMVHSEKGAKTNGKYSIAYLNKMIATKLDNLKIFLRTDYPLKLSYSNSKGTISIVHILAPRIES